MTMSEIGVPYKGYIIRPRPFDRPSGERTLDIQIWQDRGSSIEARPFHAAGSFPTWEAAIEGCVRFGQDIIDGRVPGVSVVDA